MSVLAEDFATTPVATLSTSHTRMTSHPGFGFEDSNDFNHPSADSPICNNAASARVDKDKVDDANGMSLEATPTAENLSYILPSISFNKQNSTSSGFGEGGGSVLSGVNGWSGAMSGTCSSYSVSLGSSSRSDSLSNGNGTQEDLDDPSSWPSVSQFSTNPQLLPAGGGRFNNNQAGNSILTSHSANLTKVIMVPDAAQLMTSNRGSASSTSGGLTGCEHIKKKERPVDVLLTPTSTLSKSQSTTSIYPKPEEPSMNSDSQGQTREQKNDSLSVAPAYTHQRSLSPSLKLKSDSLNNQVASLTASSTQALIFEKRPGNLPEKDPKEAKRHFEEYMMLLEEQRKRELDKQRHLQKKFQKRCKFADDMSQLQSTWLNDVIPNWSELRSSRRVRDMWWFGVPPKVRAKLWPLAIGNCLNITPELFSSLKSKSSELINLFSNCDRNSSSSEQQTSNADYRNFRRSSEDVFGLIKLDVSRTFVRYKVFQEDPFYRESLQQLLAIFVCYRHDISYIQGMNNIAAVLLLNMDLEPAFICFANLINRSLLMNFFALRLDKINHYYRLFNYFFSENLSKLYHHFTVIGLTPKFYLMQWILSLFSNCLPLDISSRMWDVYLLDGDMFLFRAALGLLKYLENDLLKMNDFTEVAQFFNKLPDDIDVEKLFSLIRSISLSKSKYNKYCEKFIESNSSTTPVSP